MDINQKSLAVLSSPYLFAISQVGAALAALAPRPSKRKWYLNPLSICLTRDGQRSTVREDKYIRNNRDFGQDCCGEVIPAKRVNRKDRRADAKFARRNPTIKVA